MKTSRLFFFLWIILCLTGCGKATAASVSSEPRDNTPVFRQPSADGTTTYGNDLASMDASHVEDGYIMVKYTGTAEKVKLQVTGPDGLPYTYDLTPGGDYDTFPFSSGEGAYLLGIYENIEKDNYALAFSQTIDVTLKDEFTPFLYPNQFVNYNKDTKAVAEGAALVKDATDDLTAVTDIYNYVKENITYDMEKASTVTSGYLPDIDETLSTKTGICFDYAALMTCMLRSQNIPTKLQIGYAGDVYHAWISIYLKEIGWVDNMIQFDGEDWTLMDPTFAASDSGSEDSLANDPGNYTVKYSR